MKSVKVANFLIVLSFLFTGILSCQKKNAPDVSPVATDSKESSVGPEHIRLQHILIGFNGSIPGKTIERNLEDAQKLASEVLSKAKTNNSDFDALVREFTDDQAPGIYGLSNFGVTPQGDEFPRERMVGAFGDVGFQLKVGEVGLATYDKSKSPYGFHIIKRLN